MPGGELVKELTAPMVAAPCRDEAAPARTCDQINDLPSIPDYEHFDDVDLLSSSRSTARCRVAARNFHMLARVFFV